MKKLTLLLLIVTATWLLVTGCGNDPEGVGNSSSGTDLGRTRAPIVPDAAGNAKVLIGFQQRPGAAEEALVRGLGGKIKYTYHLVPAIAATLPEKAVAALEKNPNVEYIEADGEWQAIAESLPWGVDHIDADLVWPSGNQGQGVKVAVIDTGIDTDHPDLVANYKGGYDFVRNDPDPEDDNGHGSHCAGIIAAMRNNGIGVIGVAPQAEVYAVKVLNRWGSGDWSDITAGIQWCADNGMHIASMSLGGGYSQTVADACDAAYGNNVLIVAAAGNSGPGVDTVIYPAKRPSVIAVAATDENDIRASFSSTGPTVELAGPGVDIYSTVLRGRYGYKSGTSMACPHVSGTAALVKAANPGMNASSIRLKLQQTAYDLGDAGRDEWYGYGLVDAEAATGETIPNEPPIANPGGPYSGAEDGPVSFDGSGSSDPDEDALTYSWDFGDGATGTGVNPNHAYTAGGTYTVTLVVNDGKVASAPSTTTAAITEVNDPPVADAGSAQTALVGEAVTFDGSGSYDIDGDITAYAWDFSDEATGTGVTPTHTYATAGTYAVTLVVTDNGGLTGTDTATVTVTDAPAYPTLHVASIVMSLKTSGPNVNAVATVTIVDADGDPVEDAVEGAIVSGQWSGLTSDSDSGVTDASGEVALSSRKVRNASGAFTFNVMNVTKEGWTYDESANVETSDSISVP